MAELDRAILEEVEELMNIAERSAEQNVIARFQNNHGYMATPWQNSTAILEEAEELWKIGNALQKRSDQMRAERIALSQNNHTREFSPETLGNGCTSTNALQNRSDQMRAERIALIQNNHTREFSPETLGNGYTSTPWRNTTDILEEAEELMEIGAIGAERDAEGNRKCQVWKRRKREESKKIEAERIAEATSLEPHAHDVMCSRSWQYQNHPGNEWFRILVRDNCSQYHSLPKGNKMLVAEGIVQAIQQQDPPGRFIKLRKCNGNGKRDSQEWVSITYTQAVNKVCSDLLKDYRTNKYHKCKSKLEELKQQASLIERKPSPSVDANLGIGEDPTESVEGMQNPRDRRHDSKKQSSKRLEERVEERLQAPGGALKQKRLRVERKVCEAERKAEGKDFEAKRLEAERKQHKAEAKATEETLRAKVLEAERKLEALEAKRIEGERKQREAEERAAKELQKVQKMEAERRRIEAETRAAQEALEALHTKKLDEERKQHEAEAIRREEEMTQRKDEARRLDSESLEFYLNEEVMSRVRQTVDNLSKEFSLPRNIAPRGIALSTTAGSNSAASAASLQHGTTDMPTTAITNLPPPQIEQSVMAPIVDYRESSCDEVGFKENDEEESMVDGDGLACDDRNNGSNVGDNLREIWI